MKISSAIFIFCITAVLFLPCYNVKADGPISIYDSMDGDWQVSAIVGSSGHTYNEYSNGTYTSLPSSILGEIWGTGTDGGDYANLTFYKTFAINQSSLSLTRLKLNYWVDVMTDGPDSWGGMACHCLIKVTIHSSAGEDEYSYIVAGGTIDNSAWEWAYYFNPDMGPKVKYIDWTNQEMAPPGHGELEPPTQQWYTLDRNVSADFGFDWFGVTDVEVEIVLDGGFLYADDFKMNFDDLYLEGEPAENPCTLNINSSPGNVDFEINETIQTTPWEGAYRPNTSMTVEMPENYIADDSIFVWDSWSDGNASRLRTIVLDSNITLTGNYVYTPMPPSANFSWDPSYPITNSDVTFDASTSDPNGGTIVSYEWSFGDNGTATGETVIHSYIDPGNYTVVLNVTDSEGLFALAENTIEVRPPIPPSANFLWDPLFPTVNHTVNFDASSSVPNGGTITEYQWDFGDNETATGGNVTHSYIDAGNFTVTLNVTDSEGLSDLEEQVIEVYYTRARFTWYPDVPRENETVNFDASSSDSFNGTVVSYEWDFGDNETGAGVTVDHIYSQVGNYTVTLNITDSNGLSDSVKHLVPIRSAVHDVAVLIFAVDPYYGRTTFGLGSDVPVGAQVENHGEVQETFNVSVFANSTAVLIQQVVDLAPSSNILLWPMYCNTSGLSIGTCVMRAEATSVPGETDIADNTYVGETITLESPLHDIAIVHTDCAHFALPDSNLPIQVTISNLGNAIETFNITAYANDTAVDTITVVGMDFAPRDQAFTLIWNTTGFPAETYVITLVASPVEGETNITDNMANSGTVNFLYSDIAVLYLYPQYMHVATNATFTVDLCIFNAVDIRATQVEISFNSSILHCLNHGGGHGGPGTIWIVNWISWPPLPPFTGSMTLFSLQFEAIGEGTVCIHIVADSPWTGISDPYGNPLPFEAFDATVDIFTHDVRLTGGNLSKTIIGKGYGANYPICVYNNGLCSEDLNVTFIANDTAFQTHAIYGLNQTCSTEMTCSLNTTSLEYGSYALTATAGPVPGETRLSDNTVSGGNFIVTIPGDVNGDFEVDIFDAVKLAGVFNTNQASSNWNANIDINGNSIVDIFDAIILANYYGQHYP